MKIAHVTWGRCNPNSANGVDQTIYHLSRTQAEQGHQVWVCEVTEKEILPIPGVKVLTFAPANLHLPMGYSIPRTSRTMAQTIIALAPDIVHFHSMHVLGFPRLAARLRRAGISYCVTPHGALTPAALQRSGKFKRLFLLASERKYLNRAAFLHLVSGNELPGKDLLGLTAPHVVIPNGINPEISSFEPNLQWLREALNIPPGRLVGVFLGRLDTHHKGLDILLEAIHASTLKNITIVLIGPDFRSERSKLDQQIVALKLSEFVFLMGPQFGEDKLNALAGADFFLHPSRYEAGVPFSVLEALAMSLPCLVSFAADPEGKLAASGASLTVQPTVTELASALNHMSNMSSQQRQDMALSALKLAKHEYSWQSISVSLTNAYEKSKGG